MTSPSFATGSPDPLSEGAMSVRFVHHPDYLEALLQGFVSPMASAATVRQIADEARRCGARRVLIDVSEVTGQLTQSEHAAVGAQIAQLFGAMRVAGIAPPRRPVGEIAPSARADGADYLGFGTRAEALSLAARGRLDSHGSPHRPSGASHGVRRCECAEDRAAIGYACCAL